MKSKRHKKSGAVERKTIPITKKSGIENNADMHIDQDFPGYPHGHSKDEIIKPESKTQRKTAGIYSPKHK